MFVILDGGYLCQIRKKSFGITWPSWRFQQLDVYKRQLLVNTPILLLDEATSALDMATEKKVLNNILEHDPLRIIIVAEHRPSVFSMCHRDVYKRQLIKD